MQNITNTHTVKVGDIFGASWGYDQTNVNYYQVTKLVGKSTVEIREIKATRVDDSHVMPVKDNFTDTSHLNNYKNNEPVRKRVKSSGYRTHSLKVFEFSNAYLWDGKPNYETPLGYGH